jgi:hypothetical protein
LVRAATSRALAFGRTLKPMIGAPDAAASTTSLSVIAPTPDARIRALMSSVEMRLTALAIASADPLHVRLDDQRELLGLARREANMFSRLTGAEVVRLRSSRPWR